MILVMLIAGWGCASCALFELFHGRYERAVFRLTISVFCLFLAALGFFVLANF